VKALPAYTETGQGQTAVLLLHGIGGGQRIWHHTATALAAAGYRVLSVDLPGYGGSASLGPVDMAGFVSSTLRLVEKAAARQTVLLGHSMGGMVAQELVAQSASAVQGLVLACTSALFGRADGAWQQQFVAQRLKPLDAGLGMAGMADKLVPGLVSPNSPAAALEFARNVMAQVPEATYRAALRAIAGFDRRDSLAAIRVPTLLLAGEHDSTAPADMMQRMASKLPQSVYVCLKDAGHIANVEQPAAFNAAVLSFLHQHFPWQ
jgi:3-oxoadipate enol-lactonase